MHFQRDRQGTGTLSLESVEASRERSMYDSRNASKNQTTHKSAERPVARSFKLYSSVLTAEIICSCMISRTVVCAKPRLIKLIVTSVDSLDLPLAIEYPDLPFNDEQKRSGKIGRDAVFDEVGQLRNYSVGFGWSNQLLPEAFG